MLSPSREHRNAVADLEDFVHAVADIDDRLAVRGEPLDHFKNPNTVPLAQRRGRLIQYQNPRLVCQKTRYLDELLLADGQSADRHHRIEFAQADFLQEGTRPGCQRTPCRNRGHAVAGQEDILRHTHGRDQAQFLLRYRDALAFRPGWTRETDFATLDPECARVVVIEAADDLDERRFSGAVFANQTHDFATRDFEIDTMQRANRPEGPG